MALDLNIIVTANLRAKEVATESYVDIAAFDAWVHIPTITLQVSLNGGSWNTLTSAQTNYSSGVTYTYNWNNTGNGTIAFRAVCVSGGPANYGVSNFEVTSDNFV